MDLGSRRFNRTVTQRIGALDCDLRELRAQLDLDSGYLSTLLRGLERDGLVRVEPSAADGRVRTARLTDAGPAERATLDRLADDAAGALLAPLSGGQRTPLVAAMAEVERFPTASARVRPGTRTPGSACAPLRGAGRPVRRRLDPVLTPFRGRRRADPARRGTAGGHAARRAGRLWRAEVHAGAPAELKRMWAPAGPAAAGRTRDVHGRRRGPHAAAGDQPSAIGLYRAAGYREVAPFNDEHYADHWFEKHLPGPRTLA